MRSEKKRADEPSKYERLSGIFAVSETSSRPFASVSVVASAERRAPATTCGAATQTSGGYSGAVPGARAASHARRSSVAVTPGANDATGTPGLGTAIVSRSKYQSACRIVGQSRQRPSVSRKSDCG